MTAVPFDTLKFVQTLEKAGVPHVQAEAFAEALRQAQGESEVVTKKDLQVELAPIRADMVLLKWMMGILLAGVMSLILKAFF